IGCFDSFFFGVIGECDFTFIVFDGGCTFLPKITFGVSFGSPFLTGFLNSMSLLLYFNLVFCLGNCTPFCFDFKLLLLTILVFFTSFVVLIFFVAFVVIGYFLVTLWLVG